MGALTKEQIVKTVFHPLMLCGIIVALLVATSANAANNSRLEYDRCIARGGTALNVYGGDWWDYNGCVFGEHVRIER
jgi:hypothetical protein